MQKITVLVRFSPIYRHVSADDAAVRTVCLPLYYGVLAG